MAFDQLYFQHMEGGYPHANNGSTDAITNDANQFYIDLGKSAGYADMLVFDLTDSVIELADTITGLEVIIEDAGTNSPENTFFDIQIYHPTTDGYSDTITTEVEALSNPSTEIISVGGSTQKWGINSWTSSDLSDTDFRVRVFNPEEPGNGIALMASFIYLKVHYTPAPPSPGLIQLNNGLIEINAGRVIL